MGKDFLFNTIKEGEHLSDKLKLKKEYKLIQSYDQLTADISKNNYEWQDMDSQSNTSSTNQTQHTFKFSSDVISDLALELKGDGASVYDCGRWLGANCIDEIVVYIGKEIMKYTGVQLVQYLQHFSNSNDQKVDLMEVSDAGGGDIDTNKIIIPLITPFSKGFGGSMPIDCLQCKSDVEIRIKIRPGNVLSKTNALVFSGKPKLLYKSWTFDISSRKLLNNIFFIDISDYHEYQITGTQSEQSFRIDQGLNQKQYISSCISCVTTANKNAEFEYMQGDSASTLQVNVNNKVIYEHRSEREAKMKNLDTFGTNNLISQTSSAYYYNIPYVNDFKDKDHLTSYGKDGVQLYNHIPQLKLTLPSAVVYYVNVVHFAQSVLQINSNGSASVIY